MIAVIAPVPDHDQETGNRLHPRLVDCLIERFSNAKSFPINKETEMSMSITEKIDNILQEGWLEKWKSYGDFYTPTRTPTGVGKDSIQWKFNGRGIGGGDNFAVDNPNRGGVIYFQVPTDLTKLDAFCNALKKSIDVFHKDLLEAHKKAEVENRKIMDAELEAEKKANK